MARLIFFGDIAAGMVFKKLLMLGYDELALDQKQWKRLEKLAAERVLLPKGGDTTKYRDADALVVRLGAMVDKAMMDAMPQLKYIGMLGTGVGRIDLAYAASKGIAVCNIAGYSTESVAELVFGMVLEHLRELERAKRQAREGNYSEDGFSASEIKGKVFGVVGLGRIGARVAEIAHGFGADVRYWSRNRKEGAGYQDIDALLKEADFLSLHMEFNPATRDFLGADRINKIKPGAVVVNTAPMELVDIPALAARLAKNDITFIFDHSDELAPEDAKLLAKYTNCVFYPPIGYISREATAAKLDMFVDNIENFLSHQPTNKVN